MKKIVSILLLLTAIAVLFVGGCGNDASAEKFIGTWEMQYYDLEGEGLERPDEHDGIVFELKKGGVATKHTWFYAGSEIEQEENWIEDVEEGTWNVAENGFDLNFEAESFVFRPYNSGLMACKYAGSTKLVIGKTK